MRARADEEAAEGTLRFHAPWVKDGIYALLSGLVCAFFAVILLANRPGLPLVTGVLLALVLFAVPLIAFVYYLWWSVREFRKVVLTLGPRGVSYRKLGSLPARDIDYGPVPWASCTSVSVTYGGRSHDWLVEIDAQGEDGSSQRFSFALSHIAADKKAFIYDFAKTWQDNSRTEILLHTTETKGRTPGKTYQLLPRQEARRKTRQEPRKEAR